jgi:hypothetical protein
MPSVARRRFTSSHAGRDFVAYRDADTPLSVRTSATVQPSRSHRDRHSASCSAVERQLDGLGVHDTELDIAETTGLGAPLGRIDHARRDIRGDETTLRADALGHKEACFTRPGGELEDRLARPGIDLVDEPLRHRARALEQVHTVALPRLR